MARKAAVKPAQTSRRRPRYRCLLVLLVAVLALASAAYLLRRPLLTVAGSLLIVSDPLEKVDAAVVLGGEDSRDGERVRAGVKLYQEGWVRKVVLSGPEWPYGLHESDFSLPLAIAAGVPRADAIAVLHSGHSTQEEAEAVVPELERRGFHSIFVVTSNYHTARAKRIFSKTSGARLRVLVYAAPYEWYTPSMWWRSREGRKTFFLEAVKSFNSLLE